MVYKIKKIPVVRMKSFGELILPKYYQLADNNFAKNSAKQTARRIPWIV